MDLVSAEHFRWFNYAAVLGLALGWGARDLLLLRRHVGTGPGAHDQVFGSIVGLVICVIGLIGLVKYHQGW